MNKAKIHANRKEDWETPPSIVKPLIKQFGLTWDLAANRANRVVSSYIGPDNKVGALRDLLRMNVEDFDGLKCWINPPYGRYLPRFTEKIARIGERAEIVVALLPGSLDVGWFHDNVLAAANFIYCRRGRIQFLYEGKRPLRVGKNGRTVPNSNTGANVLAIYGPMGTAPTIADWTLLYTT